MRKLLPILLAIIVSTGLQARPHHRNYVGDSKDHIAYPIGGLGSGMFCIEGSGAISNMSVHHFPDLFHEPCAYAAIYVGGKAKVLESPVPGYKIFGRNEGGMGVGGTTWGLPRYAEGSFSAKFPFATVRLFDEEMPLSVELKAWNPFIPGDEDDSGLPVAGLEYTFTNVYSEDVVLSLQS